MKAVILAGGEGRRLKPYTLVLPKPLVPVGDIPIMEIIIRQLAYYGFKDIYLACGHLVELIKAYFKDGKKWGVNLHYSVEDKPLGTVGPLKLLKNELDEPFLVINGDILTDMSFLDIFQNHIVQGKLMTIGITEHRTKLEYGVVHLYENAVVDYEEKPEVVHHVSMGVYVFAPYILRYIEEGERMDIPDLIKKFLDEDIGINAYIYKGRWFDIGNTEDFERALLSFEKERDIYLKESGT